MADKNLTVKIAGDKANLGRALKQSKTGINQFGAFLKGFGAKFGLLGAALTGIGGVAGGGLSIKVFADQIQEVDRLTKLGKQFGLTTEQVQKFRRVATLTGTNLQQILKGFGQLSKSLIQFVRDGTGPGQKVFAELGLSAKELQAAFKTGPIETLAIFGNALQKIENPLRRSALLEELLGSRNKELAVALADVATVFGDVDAAFAKLDLGLTKKETDAVELFRDTWAEIADTIDNKLLRSMARLAGTLQPFADAMQRLLQSTIIGGIQGIGEALSDVGRQVQTFGGSNFQAFLAGNPMGRAVQAGGAALQTAGGVLQGDLSFDNVRQFFARGIRGAFETFEIPSTFTDKIVAAVRGSNLLDVIAGTSLQVPRPGTGTINGQRMADFRNLDQILSESKQQTIELRTLNRAAQQSFFRNERTGATIAVAAP